MLVVLLQPIVCHAPPASTLLQVVNRLAVIAMRASIRLDQEDLVLVVLWDIIQEALEVMFVILVKLDTSQMFPLRPYVRLAKLGNILLRQVFLHVAIVLLVQSPRLWLSRLVLSVRLEDMLKTLVRLVVIRATMVITV